MYAEDMNDNLVYDDLVENRQATLFDLLYNDNASRFQEVEYVLKENSFMNMIAEPNEMPTDLCLRNPVSTCLDFTNRKLVKEKSNFLMDFMFEQ